MIRKFIRKLKRRQPTPQKNYGEAFMVMHYQCRDCDHEIKVWNSRNGVTPFFLNCRCEECGGCNGTMMHGDWSRDHYSPYKPDDVRYIFEGPADFPKIKQVQP